MFLTLPRLMLSVALLTIASANASGGGIVADYKAVVRPLLTVHCLGCHSAEKKEGDLDLEQVASVKLARKDMPTWKNILERVESGEMPPKKNPHKPLAEKDREKLVAWIRNLVERENRVNAGDPGPATVRRLTHAEYDNTIRDLTGVDLHPTRSFPAEGPGGEGFLNASEALEISPELFSKYFGAAKQIATHAALLPDRIEFFESVDRQDWITQCVSRLTTFYADWTTDGKIPLERYCDALVRHRESIEKRTSTLAKIAQQEHLSEKYLELLWRQLNDERSSNVFLGRLRKLWNDPKFQDSAILVANITALRSMLWNPYRNAGVNLPPRPTVPAYAKSQTFFLEAGNFKPPEVAFFLGVRALGAHSNDRALVRWENPRFEEDGQPPISLREMLIKAGYEKLPAEVPPPEPRITESIVAANGYIGQVPWVPQITLDRFGRHPLGKPIDQDSFITTDSEILAIRLPADLIGKEDPTRGGTLKGLKFVVDVSVDPASSPGAIVQFNIKRNQEATAFAGIPESINPLTTPNLGPSNFAALEGLTPERIQKDADEFRDLFPLAVCVSKSAIHGHDRSHDDEPLIRLMLNDQQLQAYQRLWREYEFVSEGALRRLENFNNYAKGEGAVNDSYGLIPRRGEFELAAENLQKAFVAAEPAHLQAVLDFAGQAFRRPLRAKEKNRLQHLYQALRGQKLAHDEAIRAVLTNVLAAPEFIYRLEHSPPGAAPAPLSDWELASRLSYFLWASSPDDELSRLAADEKLRDPAVLQAQAKRMLRDQHSRGLAIEFGTQWLGVRGFDQFDGRDIKLFPEFTPEIRGDMHEETVLFLQDLFKSDRSLFELLDADYTFLNQRLAEYYGIAGVSGPDWRRVEGVRKYGRGGLFGQGSLLVKHSGASRTSPVLRGVWVLSVVLGERIAPPPKGVPTIPATEDQTALTVRQIVEKHVSDAKCAACHQRFDPIGFALENYDTVGRWREKDLGGRPIDSLGMLDGTELSGAAGLKSFLLDNRKAKLQRQFCRKLLGYALGRTLSGGDLQVLEEMNTAMNQADGHVSAAVLTILRSPQFRMIRGADSVAVE